MLDSLSIVPEERWSVTKLSEARKTIADYFTRPLVRLLAKVPITPNAITWSGFLVTIGAAVLIVTGHLFAAGFVVLIAGFLDILDGALARGTNRTTQFGAVLDSTLDRLAEAVLLLGILALFLLTEEKSTLFTLLSKEWAILMVGGALLGSLLVSYIRARAEAIGLECRVGLFTRTERVIVLALGLLLSQIDYALIIALTIIVVFSFITVGQRLLYVWRQTKN
ncbi:CDP-alcohol phosphatidyltransferase family protein [Chloroflexota bacterium]